MAKNRKKVKRKVTKAKPVAENDEWPHLQVALFCERVLEERDSGHRIPDERLDENRTGVQTVIRIVDHIHLSPEGPLPPDKAKIALPLTLMIGFKAGEAIGERKMEIDLTSPDETNHPAVVTATLRFKGGEVGVFTKVPATPVVFGGLGLYWYTVRLRGSRGSKVYTKMPLRLSIRQPQPEEAPAKGAKKAP